MAAWLDKKYEILKSRPKNKEFEELFSSYPIVVKLEKSGHSKWRLTIKDSGIGISKKTLKYMFKVGSSSHNTENNDIKRDMPVWYMPSGSFGIGLQSVFLLSNNLRITTKSRISNESLEININKDQDSIEIEDISRKKSTMALSLKLRS